MNAAMMQQMAQQIDLKAWGVPALFREVARREQQMSETIVRLADATGADIEPVEVEVDERAEVLLSAAEAMLQQRPRQWWFEVIGSQYMDRHDIAIDHAGATGEEWRETLRGWYAGMYDQGRVDQPVEEADPAEIGQAAARYIEAVFGISLREFVALVVNWSPQTAMQDVVAGPTDEMMRQLDAIAEHVDA